jgi:hypothetical protein
MIEAQASHSFASGMLTRVYSDHAGKRLRPQSASDTCTCWFVVVQGRFGVIFPLPSEGLIEF